MADAATAAQGLKRGEREKLPQTHPSKTHQFNINGHEGYIMAGLNDKGQPLTVFIQMAKEGSTTGSLLDLVGTFIAKNLQYGVPLADVVETLIQYRFEPSGPTKNPDIPFARSVAEYVGNWLGLKFLPGFQVYCKEVPQPELSLLATKP